ncbi:hypothetical protein JCM11491_003159 [Sporobolomyces phaffii]
MSHSHASAAERTQDAHEGSGPAFDASATPLDFETEADLLALLDRLRNDLRHRVTLAIERAEQGNLKGKARANEPVDRARVEALVEKKFFEHVSQTVLKNCSIAGEPYKTSKSTKKVILKGEAVETQPLDQKLDANVRKYQEQLFDAREINAKERRDAPERVAADVRKTITLDQETLQKVEAVEFELPPAEHPLRKEPENKHGISSSQAQDYFIGSKDKLKQVLRDIPDLDNSAIQATHTAIDTSKLS